MDVFPVNWDSVPEVMNKEQFFRIDKPLPDSKSTVKSIKFLYFLICNFLSFTENGLLKFFFCLFTYICCFYV